MDISLYYRKQGYDQRIPHERDRSGDTGGEAGEYKGRSLYCGKTVFGIQPGVGSVSGSCYGDELLDFLAAEKVAIRRLFAEFGLDENTVCAKFAQTADDGKTYQYKFYSLQETYSDDNE